MFQQADGLQTREHGEGIDAGWATYATDSKRAPEVAIAPCCWIGKRKSKPYLTQLFGASNEMLFFIFLRM